MSAAIQPTAIDIPLNSPTQDERAVRWGFLAGGPPSLILDGVGRMYVGHGELRRRELIPFMPQVVGGRNEGQAMLEQDYRLPAYSQVFDPEPGGPGRFSTLPNVTERKWPLECVTDVGNTYKVMGFGVLESLTGLDAPDDLYRVMEKKGQKVIVPLFHQSEAAKVFNTLLPDLNREDDGNPYISTLTQLIEYLEKEAKGRAEQMGQTQLWDEVSQAAYRCQTFYQKFVRERTKEIDDANNGRGGRSTLDEMEIEIFHELHKPLPEERAMAANARLGKQIADGLAGSGNNESLSAALLEIARMNQQTQEMMAKMLTRDKPAIEQGG